MMSSASRLSRKKKEDTTDHKGKTSSVICHQLYNGRGMDRGDIIAIIRPVAVCSILVPFLKCQGFLVTSALPRDAASVSTRFFLINQ